MSEQSNAKRGFSVLFNPAMNKGTAFTEDERDRYGLRGLLPPKVTSLKLQVSRSLENIRRKSSDIEKYIFLSALQGRNERLFYELVRSNIEEILPLIYTPTVGQACREFAHIFRQTKGLYVSWNDRGRIRQLLENWPEKNVRVIVVTDGERILGLGDLGANGMGIPIGKLQLYVACAGINPAECLPVMLDVGTNNEAICHDPLYLGLSQDRIAGDDYEGFVDEFVVAVQEVFPDALIQFEDFLTPNAYRLLNRYRDKVLCFNDDIQGTAAVALAGVLAASRISGIHLREQRIMFLGAGSAATGIADLISIALQSEGMSAEEANSHLWFVDMYGLLTKDRKDLLPHNLPYAHEHPALSFSQAIEAIRPQVLIGATGAAGTFTQEIVESLARLNERPVIFALSNPTSRAECTPQQAYDWSAGRAIFASGSPFPPVEFGGRTFQPGQGNNAYIFPGIGLGAVISRSQKITEEMFLVAARSLASQVSEKSLANGVIFPPMSDIQTVSRRIAVDVARCAFSSGLSELEMPRDLQTTIERYQYDSEY